MKASSIAIGDRRGLPADESTLARAGSRGHPLRRLAALLPSAALGALAAVAAALGGPAAPAEGATCTATATSLAQVQYWVAGLPARSTVCLANGSYGRLTLSTNKPGGGITIRPVTPGGATLAGASLAGSYLQLYGFVIKGDEVTVQPGSTGMTISHNRITGGYFGVNAGPTTTTTVNDVNIVGNQFIGPFGEDAIRANRYHDGGDDNPAGMWVYANEFTNIRENGNHSDCFQSVWGGDHLYFQANYLHDNRCQGFFVKDQPSTVDTVVAENNLFVRNNAPCDPSAPGCGQPGYFQLVGPIDGLVMRRNTIWTPENGSMATLRESGWGSVVFQSNVVWRTWSDSTSPFTNGFFSAGNIGCSWDGTWPASGITRDCSPEFANPYVGDYRVAGTIAGVTWSAADQHYGP